MSAVWRSPFEIDFGGFSGGVTPVPFPNTEVKPTSADGTWGDSPWESRTPPDFYERAPLRRGPFTFSGKIVRRGSLRSWPLPVGMTRAPAPIARRAPASRRARDPPRESAVPEARHREPRGDVTHRPAEALGPARETTRPPGERRDPAGRQQATADRVAPLPAVAARPTTGRTVSVRGRGEASAARARAGPPVSRCAGVAVPRSPVAGGSRRRHPTGRPVRPAPRPSGSATPVVRRGPRSPGARARTRRRLPGAREPPAHRWRLRSTS